VEGSLYQHRAAPKIRRCCKLARVRSWLRVLNNS